MKAMSTTLQPIDEKKTATTVVNDPKLWPFQSTHSQIADGSFTKQVSK